MDKHRPLRPVFPKAPSCMVSLHISVTLELEGLRGLTGERTSPLKRLMGTGLRL